MGERFSFIIDVLIIVLVVLSRVYFIIYIYFINVVLRKGKPMPHDKLSGTVYMAIGNS